MGKSKEYNELDLISAYGLCKGTLIMLKWGIEREDRVEYLLERISKCMESLRQLNTLPEEELFEKETL